LGYSDLKTTNLHSTTIRDIGKKIEAAVGEPEAP
jgi:hypothetical protein